MDAPAPSPSNPASQGALDALPNAISSAISSAIPTEAESQDLRSSDLSASDLSASDLSASLTRTRPARSPAPNLAQDREGDSATAEAPAASPSPETGSPAAEGSPSPEAEALPPAAPVDPNLQVRLKTVEGILTLILPPEGDKNAAAFTWSDLWQQLKQRLLGGDRFWQPNTVVHLIAGDRLLDSRQLHLIAEGLNHVQLNLRKVYTTRRQTAIAAATAGYSVSQDAARNRHQAAPQAGQALADPLYLESTLRSGADIRHDGHVIIYGDLNPGSSVTATGDILVWGRLRGIAHAGAKGNRNAVVMALQLEASQVRIASSVARVPEAPPQFPEVAHVGPTGIRIVKATEFKRSRGG